MNFCGPVALGLVLALSGCLAPEEKGGEAPLTVSEGDSDFRAPAIPLNPADHAAIFAGGCFWCVETAFESKPGVLSVTSGFIGGTLKDPSYKDVSVGGTGHAEAVRVVFDPTQTSYAQLLEIFWRNIDPTQAYGQFCDVGDPYRSAIFPINDAQREAAEASKRDLQASKRLPGPVQTTIEAGATFYPAENYHQDFYLKNPMRYKTYRYGCGRDKRLEVLWGRAPE